MTRHLAGVTVVLAAALSAAAEEPAWKRVLQGEDAKKAEQLQKRIGELEAADNYAEAVPLACHPATSGRLTPVAGRPPPRRLCLTS